MKKEIDHKIAKVNQQDHDDYSGSAEVCDLLRTINDPKELKEVIWPVFHKLWSRDVGTKGYNKGRWRMLEAVLLQLVVLVKGHDTDEELRQIKEICDRSGK